MDYFPQVYDEYYEDPTSKPDFQFSPDLLRKIGDQVDAEAKNAVKIVAVWDTVAFHGEGVMGEKIEFHNAELSRRVAHAYHALALDERRLAFRPTLWQWPANYTPGPGNNLRSMKQVWFSGAHSDVGGGNWDPTCSNISLGWMLAQCAKDDKLAFTDEVSDDYYLLPDRTRPNPNTRWTASLTRAPESKPGQSEPEPQPQPAEAHSPTIVNRLVGVAETLVGTAVDRAVSTAETLPLVSADREVFPTDRTMGRVHRSIRDRNFDEWPCGVLRVPDRQQDVSVLTHWPLSASATTNYGNALEVAEADPDADEIEGHYIERIRPTPDSKGGE